MLGGLDRPAAALAAAAAPEEGAEVGTSFSELVAATNGGKDVAQLDDAARAEEDARVRRDERRRVQWRAQFLQVDAASFLLYLVLVGLVTASVRFSRYGELDYYLSEMVRESVTQTSVDDVTEINFENITSLSDVYAFVHGPLLAALYTSTSYTGRPLPPERVHRVNEQNILVGSVRLQQVRSNLHGVCSTEAAASAETSAAPPTAPPGGVSSAMPPVFCDAWFANAEASWASGDVEDTSPIIGATPSDPACAEGGAGAASVACAPNEYTWLDATATGIGSFTGWLSAYDGSGYVVHLPHDLAAARATLATLKADGFLGPRTRAVWADFSLYNANVNRFCVVRLLFERLHNGGVMPYAQVCDDGTRLTQRTAHTACTVAHASSLTPRHRCARSTCCGTPAPTGCSS